MKEITVQATLENIAVVTGFVNAELDRVNCPAESRVQIDIAVDEIFGNIANYAYKPEEGPATVRIETGKNPLSVSISFVDHGMKFNPLSSGDPDTTLPARQRRIGGLGIFMVKKTMDDVTYDYVNGENILTIRKRIRSYTGCT